jgi:hypothetical protein
MKDGVYSFEKLEAWIKGKELAKSIYLVTRDLGFINTEKYQHIRKQAQFTSFLINALHKAVTPR